MRRTLHFSLSRARLGSHLIPAMAALILGGWSAGCGSGNDKPATPATELRGQPIQKKPVEPAAPAPEAAAAATVPATPPVVPAPPAAPAIPTPPSATTAALLEEEEAEFVQVSFEKLSGYEIEITDDILNPPTNAVPGQPLPTAEGQIPDPVKQLNDRKVAVKGFMLPLKVEGGLVTEMLIMKDQSMCCFGTTPRINEWVSVKMVDKGIKPLMDQPVTLFGKLSVGEMRENGYLVGIYSMQGERMAGPLDF